MKFDEAFEKLIGNEGSYSGNSNDSGNWTGGKISSGTLKGTKYGISAASYPSIDIKNLTLEQAKGIYIKDYWNKLGLDRLPPEMAFDMFDTAVNSGVSRAIKLLQHTVGTIEDGIIGPKTLDIASDFIPSVLKMRFNANRLLFMTNLNAWDDFGKGWARRVANNMLLI
jgi:lysozyme family protein